MIMVIPRPMKKGFSGATRENNSAIIPPNMVLNILSTPELKDSDTEDCIAVMAAIPAKNGDLKFNIWDKNMVKATARAVFKLRKPTFFIFTNLTPNRYYKYYINKVLIEQYKVSKL